MQVSKMILLCTALSASGAFAYWGWQPTEQEKDALVTQGLAEMGASTEAPRDEESCLTTQLRMSWKPSTESLPKSCTLLGKRFMIRK